MHLVLTSHANNWQKVAFGQQQQLKQTVPYLADRSCEDSGVGVRRQGARPKPYTVHTVWDDGGSAAKLLGQNALYSA